MKWLSEAELRCGDRSVESSAQSPTVCALQKTPPAVAVNQRIGRVPDRMAQVREDLRHSFASVAILSTSLMLPKHEQNVFWQDFCM